ncbi:MAG: RNA methyltransferase [Clostridia bacterium]|nr:RNA methyltransferase [Clostridia bacterium]
MIKEEKRFSSSTLFEGMTSIRAVLSSENAGARTIEKVLYDRAKEKTKAKELGYLRRISSERGFTVEAISSGGLDELAVGNTHGGILALCTERQFSAPSDADIRADGFYAMIEGIEDPYNFGYALRSLYAAGVDGILLSPRNWMSAAGVVCRASAGASELVPIYIAEVEDTIELFKSKGYKVVCADIENSVSLYEADLKKPVFLIVGGEKRGISRSVLNAADQIVRIDYGREFKASLSAASASTVLAFEVYRQNRR